MKILDEWQERFEFWRERHVDEWMADPIGRLRRRWEMFQYYRRTKNPELVELDAFRSLIGLERNMEEWPRAIPLMEQALELYDKTHEPVKREAIRKRLEAVDPTNPNVRKYFAVEEKKARQAAAEKVGKMSDGQRQALEQARALVRETGRCSTSMLQRRMGISYNHAATLVDILRAERDLL